MKLIAKIKKRLFTLLIVVALILYLYATYWISSGISTHTNVGILDYTVLEDGKKINFSVTSLDSIGYIRDMTPIETGNVLYIDFYYTFGGLNSTLGAKDEFTIEVGENCQALYFEREDGYELVLYLDPETNQWVKPTPDNE